VNLLAFTGFPAGRRAQLDFIPAETASFKTAARKLRMKVGPRKTVFLVEGDDRVGAIAELCDRIAAAGINMTAMDAVSAGNGRYAAMFWVDPRDVNKTAKALGAS
jgi:prephenate dehydratase